MRFLFLLFITVPKWALQFGALGLLLLAFVDNSVIPLPGGMDIGVLVLSYFQRDWWLYYAAAATLGATIAGWLTYRIACKGGKELLEKKLSKGMADRAYRGFEKYGFWSIVVGALLPPPLPFTPFLITAGCMQYPRNRFLSALALGRSIRYLGIAYLGAQYSRQVFQFANQYKQEAFYIALVLCVGGGLCALYWFLRIRKRKLAENASPADAEAA